jgi:general secretion pathway protein A
VSRCLLEQLPPNVDVALVLNPRLTSLELLATVCDELRIPYPRTPTSVKPLVDALYRHLLEAHGHGRRTVVIIDEAQDLPADVLEQVRLLTNLETATEKLLQIILIGQPELARILAERKLRQLAQRITARYHLTPLSRDETRAYVRHRLEVAGGDGEIFTRPAVWHVHRLSGGVPRVINVVCDRALLGAYTQGRPRVDARTVLRAAAEVLGRPRPRRHPRSAWRIVALTGIVVACVGAAVLLTPGVVNQVADGLRRLEGNILLGGGGESGGRARDAGLEPKAGGPVARGSADGTASPSVVPAATRLAGTPDGWSRGDRRLGEILRDPALHADKRAAFGSLYRRWGLPYDDVQGELACDRERLRGLECVHRTGTWRKLRRMNVPAVLELVTPAGERHYATVVGLGREEATLELGGRSATVPLAEIDPFWEGAFILLWRLPAPATATIGPGARGKVVEWVRQQLDQVDGRSDGGGGSRDVYDADLRARVVSFQQRRALATDGIVGVETLIQLSAALREPTVPWLTAAAP